MARIAGVDLPRDKRIEIGLTYIYGIGRTSADKILAQAGVNPDIRVRDLTDDDVKKISAVIDETMTVEGDLGSGLHSNYRTKRRQRPTTKMSAPYTEFLRLSFCSCCSYSLIR